MFCNILQLLSYNAPKPNTMDAVGDFMLVLVITIIFGCIGFVVFILKHEKEHKKEMQEKSLRETGNNKNSIRQYDKSLYDVTPTSSTAPGASTASTQAQESV